MPGTAGGTVRCNAVSVARAISSDLYFFLQSKPERIIKEISSFFLAC